MKREFKKVNTLYGYISFEEFEKEYDDDIFYADGKKESVIEAMNDEPNVPVDCYLFDGWYLALLS